MRRRDFLKGGSLAFGGLLLTPIGTKANIIKEEFGKKKSQEHHLYGERWNELRNPEHGRYLQQKKVGKAVALDVPI